MFLSYFSITSLLKASLLFFFLSSSLPVYSQSFTHVHLRSADPEASAEWYKTLFGGELRDFSGGMGSVAYSHGNIATMQDNGLAGSLEGGAIHHFGFAVPNVPLMLEKAEIMGASIELQPTQGILSNQIAMFRDPWGAKVELLEHPTYKGIHHVHIFTTNSSLLRDWFLEIFGGESYPQDDISDLKIIKYEGIWVHISESDQAILPSRGRSLDHFGFSVNDMDNLVARIRESGYEPYVIRPARPGSTTLLMFFEGMNNIHFEIAQFNAL